MYATLDYVIPERVRVAPAAERLLHSHDDRLGYQLGRPRRRALSEDEVMTALCQVATPLPSSARVAQDKARIMAYARTMGRSPRSAATGTPSQT